MTVDTFKSICTFDKCLKINLNAVYQILAEEEKAH